MILKLKKEFGLTLAMVNLMEDDMVVALGFSMLASNIKKKICDVLHGVFSFYDEKKTHNMLFFMLDSRFKSFRLVFSFIGKKTSCFYDGRILLVKKSCFYGGRI
jgi:hypothetical protein